MNGDVLLPCDSTAFPDPADAVGADQGEAFAKHPGRCVKVAQPLDMAKEEFLVRWDEIMEAVHRLAADMDGSISAEHGIGYMKRDELTRFKSEVELDLMRRIKAALDPKNILNPGKVV